MVAECGGGEVVAVKVGRRKGRRHRECGAKNSAPIYTRLPFPLLDQLEAFATRSRRSRAQAVRDLIALALRADLGAGLTPERP